MANINIGTGILDLIANTARLSTDLGKALSHVEKFQRSANRLLGVVGIGLSAAGFIGFIKGAIDSADAMNDLRKRVGGTAQDLLILQGAAVRSGVGIEEISGVISKMTPRLQDAANGVGDSAAAFKLLNIDVLDANKNLKTIPQILEESGKKFREFKDSTDKSALAIAAFGKGGDRLVAVAEAIEETRERFQRLGITIDEKVIKQADEFNDSMQDVKAVMAVLSNQLIGQLLPHLITAANAMAEMGKNTSVMGGMISAVVIPLKVFATGFATLYSFVAAASEAIVAHVFALDKLRKFDFKGAYDELIEGRKRALAVLSSTADVTSKLWEEMQPPKIKPVDLGGTKNAPRIPDTSKVKASNDALLRLTEEREKRELEIVKYAVDQRTKLLDFMYQHNQISNTEYWDERIQTTTYAFEQESKLLDKFIARQDAAVKATAKGSAEYYKALGNLEESQSKRNRLEEEFGASRNQIYREKKLAAQEYADEVERLNIQMLELNGNTAEATAKTLKLQNRPLREKFEVNNDTGSQALLTKVEARTVAQAEFNQEVEKSSRITELLGIEETRIQNSVKIGAISQIEGMRRTGDARQKAVQQLEEFQVALNRIAEANPGTKLEIDAKRAGAALEVLKGQANVLADTFNKIFEDSFGTFVEDMVGGTKTIGDAFNDMFKNINREITKLAAQDIASSIFGSKSSGGGLGGIAANIFSSAGSSKGGSFPGYFSGDTAGSLGNTGGGWLSSIGSGIGGFISNLFKAKGGPVSANQPYMVGEKGPELIVPKQAGLVINNGQTEKIVNQASKRNSDQNNIVNKIQMRAAGGPVLKDAPYLVGERGPEIIMPKQAGVVIPTGQTQNIVKKLSQTSNVINAQSKAIASSDVLNRVVSNSTLSNVVNTAERNHSQTNVNRVHEIANVISSTLMSASRIPRRADGGPVKANQPYMVGERGIEIVVPKQVRPFVQNIAGNILRQSINKPMAPRDVVKQIQSRIIQIPGRANGGPMIGKAPYIVGEKGPELIIPKQAGIVIPNDRTATIISMVERRQKAMADVTKQTLLDMPLPGKSSALQRFIENIPGRASGGAMSANTPYIVGEQGRELVIPKHGSPPSSGGSSGGNSPIIINVTTPDADSFRRSKGQIAGEYARALAYGRRNQ